MKKRIFLFTLVLSILMCIFAISVFAGDIITVDNIKYEITSSSTVNFNANDPTDDTTLGTLIIPETITYNGTTYTVTGVTRGKSWPDNNEYINSVIKVELPATVNSVPEHIFRNYKGLQEVKFLGNIPSFNNAEFYQCTALTKVELANPTALTKIGGSVFYYCSNLVTFEIPQTVTVVDGEAFRECKKLTGNINLPNLKTLGGSAFRGCAAISSVKIGGTISGVANHAFYGAKSVTSIDFSACTNLTYIGENAFRECEKATSIIVPSGYTSIGNYAYQNCYALESVVIHDGVLTIGQYAFQSDSKIKSIIIPDSVTSIGYMAFQSSGLTSVKMSNAVTTFGGNCFQGTKISSVILPATLTTTEKDIFNSVSTLNTVVFANSNVSGYTNTLFSSCSNIKLVFYAGSDPTTLTTRFSQLSSFTNFVTYEQHLANLKTVGFTGYETKTIVYGTSNCGGCSDIDTSEFSFDFISFTEKMYDRKACDKCGYVDKTAGIVEYDPILVIKGYTVEEGTNGSSMAYGFTIDKDSLAKYQNETGITLSYGLIVGSTDGNTDGKIVDKDGNSLLNSAIAAELSGASLEKFTIYNIKLTDIKTDNQKALPIFLCAYVISGEKVVYLGEDEKDFAVAISYNDINK